MPWGSLKVIRAWVDLAGYYLMAWNHVARSGATERLGSMAEGCWGAPGCAIYLGISLRYSRTRPLSIERHRFHGEIEVAGHVVPLVLLREAFDWLTQQNNVFLALGFCRRCHRKPQKPVTHRLLCSLRVRTCAQCRFSQRGC